MRRLFCSGLLLATVVVTGCSSSDGVDRVMAVPTSDETTASVRLPRAPVPGQSMSDEKEAVDAQSAVVKAVQQPLPPKSNPSEFASMAPAKPEPPKARPVPQAKPASLSGGARNQFADLEVYGSRFRDAKPVNFGRASPHPFEVHGVDVSHWQGKIDWKTLRKQGANFAFIKATEGGKHVDRLFKTNWDNAHSAGIPTGAYHFFYWCRNAKQQAEWFIRHVPKQKGSLPPVLDVEWNGNKKTCPGKLPRKTVLKKMQVWLDLVEAHYGVKPIIYVTPDFYEDNLRGGKFSEYSFWLRSVAEHPRGRYPKRAFAFWQYSGTGLAKGVSTQIDLNVFNGNEEGWKRWLNARVQ